MNTNEHINNQVCVNCKKEVETAKKYNDSYIYWGTALNWDCPHCDKKNILNERGYI